MFDETRESGGIYFCSLLGEMELRRERRKESRRETNNMRKSPRNFKEFPIFNFKIAFAKVNSFLALLDLT